MADAGLSQRAKKDAGILCPACARRWATSRLFRLRLAAERADDDWWRRRALGRSAAPEPTQHPSGKGRVKGEGGVPT